MKKLVLALCLGLWLPAWAQRDSADAVLTAVYGTLGTACTQDADADTGGHNRLGPFTANRRYLVYCHDGAGAGVACEILQGTVAVDATAAVGTTLFAGEKLIVKFTTAKTYISALPFANNQYYDVCPLD